MDDTIAIIKSFSPQTPKVQLSSIIWWYMMETPQKHILSKFLIEIFPSLTEKSDHATWNLDGYGASAASKAIIDLYCFNQSFNNKNTDFNNLLSIWVSQNFFAFIPNQWHHCSIECNKMCTIRSKHLELVSILLRIAIDFECDHLLTYIAYLCVWYKDTVLLSEVGKADFEFSFDQSISLFFSPVNSTTRAFIYKHSSSNFKTELKTILGNEDVTISVKNGTIFTSSEVFLHVSDFTSSLEPDEFDSVRSELGLVKGYTLPDFIASCKYGNYSLVKKMIDSAFPSYIRKRCHLTDVLNALSSRENCPEWNAVFDYIVKVTDKSKTKLHSEDSIYLMVRSFFVDKRPTLSALTDWNRPPNFVGGCVLLTNLELLRELESNKKLTIWASKPHRSYINVNVNQVIDDRCLFILRKYNLIGDFYH